MQKRHYTEISNDDVKKIEKGIVRLQALMKGYSVFQKFGVKPIKGEFDDSVKIEDYLQNKEVNAMRRKHGAFDYDEINPNLIRKDLKLVSKGPFKLEKGPVYQG